ncbi:hypothetical protein J6S88_01760 [bacterium]|nr:hypothetical protein [bacterium]
MLNHSADNISADNVANENILLFQMNSGNTLQIGDSFQITTPQDNNGIPPERRAELENWTLNWDLYVNTDDIDEEESMCDYHFDHKKEILDMYNGWYQEYLAAHDGVEMNFITAMQYLKDNPDEDEAVKEFIKKSFGICDGDVSRNQQQGKGSCHLLSCRAELEDSDNPEIQEIVRNLVVQNEDGTVTVTFAGVRDEQGNPLQFIIKNEEIKDSYTNFDESTVLRGGSTDPDDAALEIGYQRLKEYLIANYPIDYQTKFNEIETKIKQYEAEKHSASNTQNDILETVYLRGYQTIFEQLQTSDKPEDKELLNFIVSNMSGHETDPWYVKGLIDSKRAKETTFTYASFDEHFDVNVYRTSSMQSLMNQKVLNLLKTDPEYSELYAQYQETKTTIANLRTRVEELNNQRNQISTLKALYDEEELGSRANLTFKLLTGKGRYIKELHGYDIKDYLSKNKDNINKIPIQVSGFSWHHGLMFDNVTTDEFGNLKEVTITNPHNCGEGEDDDDFTTSGNIRNTFTMSYNDFWTNFSITIIDSEADESKEDYFQLPFNYDTY